MAGGGFHVTVATTNGSKDTDSSWSGGCDIYTRTESDKLCGEQVCVSDSSCVSTNLMWKSTCNKCDCLWENRSYRPFKSIEKRRF